MLEIIKEAGSILKDLPDLAIWILVGILFYKVFVIGSVISLIKFAITKIYSILTKPKETIIKYDYNDYVYTHDEALKMHNNFLKGIYKGKKCHRLSCDDVKFLVEAFNEKVKRERDENKYFSIYSEVDIADFN